MQNAFHNFCRDLTDFEARERSQPNTYLKSLGRLADYFFGYLRRPATTQIIAVHYFFAPPAIADYELKQGHHLFSSLIISALKNQYRFVV